MSVQIIVTAGPDKGRSFPLLAGEPLQVGRSKSTSTQLTDPTVSRVHCEIEWDGERVTVHNISDNGTLINGVRITEAELTPRDVIRIGESELRLLSGSEEPTTLGPAGEKKPVAAEPLVNLVGKTLSNFAIEAMIAKGASSVIFRARDTTDDSPVALKVLQPEFATNDEDVQRFIRAMKTVLGLRHPNLVSLHKAGKTGNYCWLAMDLVEGESMAQVIRRLGVANMLDWRYGYRVAVHIARALEYAHEQSIIHRNVTPQNIMWRTADKMVLLGDLMLAKALEGTLAHQITRPGELLGDVAYMAPERTRGVGDVDGRSDLYGLGATVYALVAGRPPFAEESLPELVAKIRTAEPDKPKKYQMAIPDMFQGTVLRLLAKRPDDRFQTATEVLADLDRVGKFAGVSA
jgi:serine/threonine-protein kinase